MINKYINNAPFQSQIYTVLANKETHDKNKNKADVNIKMFQITIKMPYVI